MCSLKGYEAKFTYLGSMDARSNGACVDYRASGSDEERWERLRDADDAPDIYVIHALCRVYIEIQRWHNDCLTSIIYEEVKSSSGLLFNIFDSSLDTRRRCRVELKQCYLRKRC